MHDYDNKKVIIRQNEKIVNKYNPNYFIFFVEQFSAQQTYFVKLLQKF